MSYSESTKLQDAYDTFQEVCNNYGYQCLRVDDSNTLGRIVPEILEK